MMYAGNDRNLLRTAILAATNVVASQVVYRSDAAEKQGGGRVTLSGNYTGASNATFDVQVVDSASSTPRLSAPVPSGVGNGAMTGLTASGVDSQQFVVTLYNLGTATTHAFLPFQGATLEAIDAGEGGNAITLSIDDSGLILSDTDYAIQAAITAGTNEYFGDEWDFGAPALTAAGEIPPGAPRLRFGYDPQVYRQFKKFADNRWAYGFSPAPVRDVERGTAVYAVSGSRTVTITDGTDSNVFPSIVTEFDFLDAVQIYEAEADALVRVATGFASENFTPGGQAVVDLSVWTAPYLVGLTRAGSEYVEKADLDVTMGAGVPTETLAVRCVTARPPGGEEWFVEGDVSGRLANARTGSGYNSGGYSFTIPRVPNPDGQSFGEINVRIVLVEQEGRGDPGFKALQSIVGAAGTSGSWTFEYRARPPADCEVQGTLIGGPDADCLGITPPGDTQMNAARLLARRQRLSRFVHEFVKANTKDVPASQLSSVNQDITYIKKAANALGDVLVALEAADDLQPDARLDSHEYAQDQQITRTISGVDYLFFASIPGTSASSAPDFSGATALNATVTDGGVTWKNNGKTAMGLWDAAMDLLIADATPIFNHAGESSAAGDWDMDTPYALGATTRKEGFGGVMVLFEVTDAGTSHATDEPNWASAEEDGDVVTDGTVEWTRIAADSLDGVTSGEGRAIDESYYERYLTAGNQIKAAAGLSANFDKASDQGDGCWLDDENATHEFAYLGDEPYAPVLVGRYYHSSKQEVLEDGTTRTVSTQEFGFGPTFGCPQNLIDGDRIVVTVSGEHGSVGYQVGDRFEIQAVRAVPLAFGGGQTGNDLRKWSVVGSVDGRLADYVQDISDPGSINAYSDGGVGFLIGLGAIDNALGDGFTFSVEAAQFVWRKNAGDWSSPADITSGAIALSDGVSALFAGGRAPSWVVDDLWTFTAEAVNGVDQLRQPTDGRLTWTGSTTITATLAEAAPIAGLLLAEHTIPSGAEIRLQGSDDNFSTTPLNELVPWRARNLWHPVVAEHAAYRILVDDAGSLFWGFLGEPLVPAIRTGQRELGRLVKTHRLAGLGQRPGLGGTIQHEQLTEPSVDALLALLEHAGQYDDRRLGIVPNAARPEAGVVEFLADTLEISDVFGFQPRDIAASRQSVTLELSPIR